MSDEQARKMKEREDRRLAALAKLEVKLVKAKAAELQMMKAKRYISWSNPEDVEAGSYGIMAQTPWLCFFDSPDLAFNMIEVFRSHMHVHK